MSTAESQSRWALEFRNHPFQTQWAYLKSELGSTTLDDETELPTVLELARFRRVVEHLDRMIAGVDPDMVPRSLWSNIQVHIEPCLAQLNHFKSTNSVAHLQAANDHADNLLSYLKPFSMPPAEVLDALGPSLNMYLSTLGDYVLSFKKDADLSLVEIKKDRDAAALKLKGLNKTHDKIAEFGTELFGDSDESESVQTQIQGAHALVKEWVKEIEGLHRKMTVDGPRELSVKTSVEGISNSVRKRHTEISELVDASNQAVDELKGFHDKIYGKINDETGERAGGLQWELDRRMTALDEYENQQRDKHTALHDRVEKLLPGAATAALATAYRALKEGFDAPIRRYTYMFSGALIALAVGAVFLSIQSVSIWPSFGIDFVGLAGWDAMARSLVGKLGYVVPVVWLAIFSATRRSQYERLQQEYAHKEALATSYESYKKQLSEIGSSDELQRELIAKAIEAISYNASVTLDGKGHNEKTPIMSILEGANFSDLIKALELLKIKNSM